MKVILILSGGADSTTLLFDYLHHQADVDCVTFSYGQNHKREIESAKKVIKIASKRFGKQIRHDIITIDGFESAVESALIGGDIPHGHYQEETMKQTVVPNRNMVMISIAASIAISRGAEIIAIGAHSGDHAIYPDCRQNFLTHAETAIWSGNWGNRPRVKAPYVGMTKGEIIKIGKQLRVPYDETWTCYEGGDKPCGRCGSCVERDEAFSEAA